MTIKIGISTSDPRLAALVYKDMVEKTYVWTFNEFPEVVIYGSNRSDPHKISSVGAIHHANERASILSILEADLMIVPDIATGQIKGNPRLSNAVPILDTPRGLPLLNSEMLDGIEQNLYERTSPDDIELAKKYDAAVTAISAWADVAILNTDRVSGDVILKSARNTFKETPLQKVLAGGENVPLVAISGGITPWSTVESLMYSSFNHNNALVAISAAKTPNPVPRVKEETFKTVAKAGTESPLPKLLETNRLLEKVNPTLLMVDCNTVHHFFDEIKAAYKKPIINIIDETVLKLPPNSKALMLGSEATAGAELYPDAVRRLRPDDNIEIITPDKTQQSIINSALFDDILTGDLVRGGKRLKSVVDYYDRKCGGDLLIIGGCTEVGMGLSALKNKDIDLIVFDSAHAGYDRAKEFLDKRGAVTL